MIDVCIGVSWVFINYNVFYEYVIFLDFCDGFVGCYCVIYLLFVIVIDLEIIGIFIEYVENGGWVVIDMFFVWYDENGVLFYLDKGIFFEKLFGVIINDY